MRKELVFIFYLLLLLPWVSNSQNLQIDSLRNALVHTEDTDSKAALHLSLFKALNRKQPDSSLQHLKKALLFSKGTQNDSLAGSLDLAQIENHLTYHRYDSVFHYTNSALSRKQSLTPKQIVGVYTMGGLAHYYRSEYAKAISWHLKAEKVSSLHKLGEGRARVLNNIGISYIKLEDWLNAEAYMAKSLALCYKYDLKRGTSYTLGNLGIIYKNLGRFKDAINAYLESNVICEELRDQRGIARNYDNLGSLYEEQGDYRLALEYYQRSLEKSKVNNDLTSMSSALHNLGNLHSKQERYLDAKSSYTKSLEIAKRLDLKDALRNNYLGLANVHELIGDFPQALAYHKLYGNWKDSIVNESHLKDISELEIKYQSEKKEKDILALSEEKLKADINLAKQDSKIRKLSIGIAGIILVFALAFVLFRQHNKNQKQKDLIGAIADTQFAERKRISQDLHDSVGGSLALAKNKLLNLQDGEYKDAEEVDTTIKILTKTSEQVRQISHNLMPGELVKFGLVSAIQTTLDHLEDSELSVQLFAHEMENRIDSTKEIYLFRIFQEIIQNVLKHAKASQLNIYLNKHKNYMNLMVEDDGIGIKVNSKPGMGLTNIKSRVDHLKGTVNIDSVVGKGTTMNIQIPI
ncbi:tetratricopeptide repeat-containing sensor histidine kinase [Flagellimonas allohymeniacidonis]|uniref:Oxygen sensor histidine kinase NreB n=1 Tax=Flagellimonas allohymeniacidonis TaxID=2517819 RepID=A0A4Q8QEX6_9FLAO|nr:sensor histidine kinase [Allomuricauda hymeniacidonis]TAI49011.1 tetratricopeptide repeat protein [Allomuricauda hymeniacidonis]